MAIGVGFMNSRIDIEHFLGEGGSRSTSNGLSREISTLICIYVLYFKIPARQSSKVDDDVEDDVPQIPSRMQRRDPTVRRDISSRPLLTFDCDNAA